MKDYKIEWFETKISAKNHTYAKVSLRDATGTLIDATIFSSFPNFANLKPGDTVSGELKSQEFKGNTTYTLEFPKPSTTGNFGRSGGIAKAQETKHEHIKEAQESKGHAVKVASTMGGAVQLAIAEYNTYHPEQGAIRPTLEFLIEKYRKFLWMHWEVDEKNYPPF